MDKCKECEYFVSVAKTENPDENEKKCGNRKSPRGGDCLTGEEDACKEFKKK